MKENISGQYRNPEKKKSRFLTPLVFVGIIGATSAPAMANIHQAQKENIDTKNPISLTTTPEPEQVAWFGERPLSDQTYLENYQLQQRGNKEIMKGLKSKQAKIDATIQQGKTRYEQWTNETPVIWNPIKRAAGAWSYGKELNKYTEKKNSIAGDLDTIRDNEEELVDTMCSEMVSRNGHHRVEIAFDDGRKVSCTSGGFNRIKDSLHNFTKPKIPREYNVPGGGWIQ